MTSSKAAKATGGDAATGPYAFLFAPFAAVGGTGSGTDLAGTGFGTWMRMTELMFSKLTEIQQEELRFLARRLERDVQHQGDMAGCRSPSEAAEILSAFIRTMVEDYTDNGRRLADATGELQAALARLGGAGGASATAPLQHAAE